MRRVRIMGYRCLPHLAPREMCSEPPRECEFLAQLMEISVLQTVEEEEGVEMVVEVEEAEAHGGVPGAETRVALQR